MSNHKNFIVEPTDDRVQATLETIWNIAYESKTDTLQLLAILRSLESLHQQIRDTLFQESLPENRQSLYVLLKDIEAQGGWPYIYRPRLRELIAQLAQPGGGMEQQEDSQSISSSNPVGLNE